MEQNRFIDPGPGKFSDSQVVERVILGEKQLFEILLRRNNQKLYRVVKGYLKDEDEIEDAMQESYVKAYENLGNFKGKSAFSTWLIRIAINECLNKISKKGKLVSINSSDAMDDAMNKIPNRTRSITPENKMIRKEMKNILEVSIEELPEKYRAVYIMREVEEMSYSEISLCLDISESNIKVRLHRAKSMLRELILQTTTLYDIYEFGNFRCDKMVSRVMQEIEGQT